MLGTDSSFLAESEASMILLISSDLVPETRRPIPLHMIFNSEAFMSLSAL